MRPLFLAIANNLGKMYDLMEVTIDDRLYQGLLLRAPQRSPYGSWPACVIRTPVLRFQKQRVRGQPTQHLMLRQNWPRGKGEVILFPVNPDWNLQTHWKHLLEDAWTLDVLPVLRKRRLEQGELFAVQLLHPPGGEPFLRVNEEVRTRACLLPHREAPTWFHSMGQLSESGIVFKLNLESMRQLLGATGQVVGLQLLDDERTRYGHFTCLRIGASWQGMFDLVGLLPQSVQYVIDAWDSVFSRTIISTRYGDDLAKDQLLHQLNVDIYSLPEPLKEEALNLVYASVFRSYEDTPIQQMPGMISRLLSEEISREKGSLSWDEFPNYPDRLTISREQAIDWKRETEQLFAAAGLSKKERAIVQLNFMLVCRDEEWTRRQKANYLNMGVKSYEKHLGHARMVLRTAKRKPIPEGYKRLLNEILKGG